MDKSDGVPLPGVSITLPVENDGLEILIFYTEIYRDPPNKEILAQEEAERKLELVVIDENGAEDLAGTRELCGRLLDLKEVST